MPLTKTTALGEIIVNPISGLITAREVTTIHNDVTGEDMNGMETIRRYIHEGREHLVENMPEDTVVVAGATDDALAPEYAEVKAVAQAVWTTQFFALVDAMTIQAVGLCEAVFIDRIDINPTVGILSIRRNTTTFDDGEYQAHEFHRHCLCPNEAVTDQDAMVVAITDAIWTPTVVAAYEDAVDLPG